MRPLIELDDGVLRALRGVVFDIDDTLTTRGALTDEAYGALWTLRAAGLVLVPVTGRPLGWTDAAASWWPVDVAVGENGAGFAWRAGRAIATGYFDDEAARAAQAAELGRLRAAIRAEHPGVREASDQGARRCDVAFDVGEGQRLDEGAIAALVRSIEQRGARALVSSVHAHVIVGRWDKASGAMRAIREALGLDPARELDRWLFVGDSGNDAAAFEAFTVTVGVANVREHLARLPVPPRWVTENARGAGFAELAARIARARGDGGA